MAANSIKFLLYLTLTITSILLAYSIETGILPISVIAGHLNLEVKVVESYTILALFILSILFGAMALRQLVLAVVGTLRGGSGEGA